MPIPVFMFHGVNKDGSFLEGADQFYAVSSAFYQSAIQESVEKNIPIHSLENIIATLDHIQSNSQSDQNVEIDVTNCCSFTFDDGHISNYEAAKALHAHGYSADFFVNSSTIDTKHFLSSSQLKEMIDMGMSIQSHGHTHDFMNDLEDSALRDQLQRSKELISEASGKEVTIFAPPGGRYDQRLITFAKELGYNAISNSEPGYLHVAKVEAFTIPRVAITSATSLSLYQQLLRCDGAPIRKDQLKYWVTKQAKRALGNRRYEMVWKLLRG